MEAALLSRPNPTAGLPLYLQLVGQLRRGLETGALRPGEALPDIRPVAEALVVHPGAVARAYDELEQQRLVVRVNGVLRAGARPPAALVESPGERHIRALELKSAGEVQQCLMPQSSARLAGLDCAGISQPARGVTGDYYDFIPLPDQRVAIVLGDVCGKGIPAAILMAALRGYLHGATAEGQSDPQSLVEAMSQHLHRSAPASRFATMFYGVYDAKTRTLEYVTAGHQPPLLLREGTDRPRPLPLDHGGVALGIMPDAEYLSARVQLEPGDLLVAFTDGMTEAMDAAGEEWGEDRLVDALEAVRPSAVGLIAERVLAAATDFTGGGPQHDDMTMVAVRVM